MVNGVYLSLLAGPVKPLPVPSSVINSLTSVRVTNASTEDSRKDELPRFARSGFELEFQLTRNSPLEALFPLTGSVPPLVRIILVVTINGRQQVIIDGFIQKHKITPGTGTNPPKLTLYGKDLTVAMDLVDYSGLPYPAVPVAGRVALMLTKYAVLGVIPKIIPPVFDEVSDPSEKILSQKGTDYTYLSTLARDRGYVFYIEPGPSPGTSQAYWGPEIKIGTPQPALNLDMDTFTNVNSLSFDFDNEHNKTPVMWIRPDEIPVPIPIPIPDINLLNPTLANISPTAFRKEPLSNVARMSFPQAMQYGLARSSAAAECVTAEGVLNVARYGRLLKARQLVGVRGAGKAFDGLYYVKSVTHEIKRGEYLQSFKLSRNGLVSTVSRVPV
ncbi:hypothetical protein [Gimesia algae]|uniref:Phage late control gene D protein (GPD) n=1 Tax=Gimesia algae TaxID=2527971 RepID=A0A517VBS8_9PLAN|nr:hypothetical protein [Gimesia algae]QDT90457.1 hypothetical protein Pan161_21090 [Gimesia algae]